jgi:DNA-binding response OmpR family regulator
MQNHDQVLSQDMILNHVWSYGCEVETRVVDVYIGYLRRKIDLSAKIKLIRTVRGFGYSITNPVPDR